MCKLSQYLQLKHLQDKHKEINNKQIYKKAPIFFQKS